MQRAANKAEPAIVARGKDAEFWETVRPTIEKLNELIRRWPLIKNNPYVWTQISQLGKELSTRILAEGDPEIAEFYNDMLRRIFDQEAKQVKFGSLPKLAERAKAGMFAGTPERLLPMSSEYNPPKQLSWSDGIKADIEAVRARGLGLDQVLEIGHKVRLEMESRLGSTPAAEYAAWATENNVLIDRINKLQSETPEWQAQLSKLQVRNAKLKELQVKMDADPRKRADIVAEMLAEVRSMGYGKDPDLEQITLSMFSRESEPGAIDAIHRVADYFPTSWIEKSTEKGTMTAKMEGRRGQYNHGLKELQVPLFSERGSDIYSVAAHEYGHRMEYTVPGVLEAETQFYQMRTKGETPQKLGPQYEDWEVTRKDKFTSEYMGKDYYGRAFELFSMGQERIFFGKYMGDIEFDAFILGLLTTVP